MVVKHVKPRSLRGLAVGTSTFPDGILFTSGIGQGPQHDRRGCNWK